MSKTRKFIVILGFSINCLVTISTYQALKEMGKGLKLLQELLFLGTLFSGFLIILLLGIISSNQTRKSMRNKSQVSEISKLMAFLHIASTMVISIGYVYIASTLIYGPLFNIISVNQIFLMIINYISESIMIPLALYQWNIISKQYRLITSNIDGKYLKFPAIQPAIEAPPSPPPSDERIEKIRRMMRVSTKINLDRMQNALKMKKEIFDEKVFEWAEEFDFTIDGDYLIVNKDTLSDFIETLDKQFATWEKMEESRSGKI